MVFITLTWNFMRTYQELLAQKAVLDKQSAELERQLQDARHAERAGVIAHIKQLLVQNDLTLEDLSLKSGSGGVLKGKQAHSQAGRHVAPKYRDAETGNTWSGRGLKPKWVQAALAAGKTLSELKI